MIVRVYFPIYTRFQSSGSSMSSCRAPAVYFHLETGIASGLVVRDREPGDRNHASARLCGYLLRYVELEALELASTRVSLPSSIRSDCPTTACVHPAL